MATNVRGYSIPVLYLSPGVDEKKIAEVVTSVLLRAALSASTPWPKWILLAALELLHGRRPAPLDAEALSFLTQQSTVHTRADNTIFEAADVADQVSLEHHSSSTILDAAVKFHGKVTSEDEFATPVSLESSIDKNVQAPMNSKFDPLKLSEAGDQRPRCFKNAPANSRVRESPTNAEQPPVVLELILSEDGNKSMVDANETGEYLDYDSHISKTILTPAPALNNKFIESNKKHIGKGSKMTKYVDSATTAFSSACSAPSVQSVPSKNISLDRMNLGADERIGARSIAYSNLNNDLCCTKTLETALQVESKGKRNNEKSPSYLSRNRLTSDIHDARNCITYSSKLCPPFQTADNHHHQLGTSVDITKSATTLTAYDKRLTNNVPILTRRILPSELLLTQEHINDTAVLQLTAAPCDPLTKDIICQKRLYSSTETSNKPPSPASSSSKGSQTDRCNTANIETQAQVKMITKWIQVKKIKKLDKAVQNLVASTNIEIQTCDGVLATVHASTQTDLAGIDGEAVIKRSCVVDKEAQTILVYTNSVGVQVHTKKKSSSAVGWRLTPVSGVAPSPRLMTSINATPDGGEREGVQLFHGRPLNRAVEKITPLIPLQALDGMDAFLSDPRLQ